MVRLCCRPREITLHHSLQNFPHKDQVLVQRQGEDGQLLQGEALLRSDHRHRVCQTNNQQRCFQRSPSLFNVHEKQITSNEGPRGVAVWLGRGVDQTIQLFFKIHFPLKKTWALLIEQSIKVELGPVEFYVYYVQYPFKYNSYSTFQYVQPNLYDNCCKCYTQVNAASTSWDLVHHLVHLVHHLVHLELKITRAVLPVDCSTCINCFFVSISCGSPKTCGHGVWLWRSTC